MTQDNKKEDMKEYGLKKEVLDEIKGNGILFGKIAYILGITPGSLPRLLIANHPKLTQVSVLRILKDFLKVKQDSELLEERTEKSEAA